MSIGKALARLKETFFGSELDLRVKLFNANMSHEIRTPINTICPTSAATS